MIEEILSNQPSWGDEASGKILSSFFVNQVL